MPINRHLEKEIAATYARVLFDAAYEAGGQQEVLEVRDQAELVLGILRTNMDLQSALADTTYDSDQRANLARSVFADCAQELTSVLAIMAERLEIEKLVRVIDAYGAELEAKLNISVVDVTTAVELDDHLRELITKKAEADLESKVVLREHIDKSLLGGIRMTSGTTRIDASLKTQLEHARSVLKQTTDGGECS